MEEEFSLIFVVSPHKLINVIGPESRRRMMDGKRLHGTHVTQPCVCESVCDVVTEEESEHVPVSLVPRGRKRQPGETVCVCLFKCVFEYVFLRWQNKRPPLSCVALRKLCGVGAPISPAALSLRPSLELPVCLFPHRRAAKQQGPPPLPRVRSLSTPGKLWSDGQKKGVWEGLWEALSSG